MKQERIEFYLFSAIMSLIMSGGMSLAMGLITVELVEALSTWPMMWILSFAVAFPLSVFVVPVTQKLVNRLVGNKP